MTALVLKKNSSQVTHISSTTVFDTIFNLTYFTFFPYFIYERPSPPIHFKNRTRLLPRVRKWLRAALG